MRDLIYAASSADDGTAWGDLIGLVLIAVMWALSLAALAGIAYMMSRWFKHREERMKRPADPERSPWNSLSRRQKRSVRRGKVRQDNASDLDGYL